eukprot:13121420-Alexandrium_andersonii.AAC.1
MLQNAYYWCAHHSLARLGADLCFIGRDVDAQHGRHLGAQGIESSNVSEGAVLSSLSLEPRGQNTID